MTNSLLAGLQPAHPGELLRAEVIPGSGLTKTAFAKRLGISREALHNVLSGKSAVTTVLALKLARLLGTSAEVWLNMQQAYDISTTLAARRSEIDEVKALES